MYASYGYTPLMNVLLIWLAGLMFAVLHSVFAMQRCKNIFYRIGLNAKTYRMIYTLISTTLTILWLGFAHLLPDSDVYRVHGWLYVLMTAVQLAGLVIIILSLRAINVSAFLGFSRYQEVQDEFTEYGIYRYVRHPMYSGIMLALLASSVQTVNSLNLFAVITLYFIIGSILEEKRMLAIHPQYADYQRRVPAFIPNPVKKAAHE